MRCAAAHPLSPSLRLVHRFEVHELRGQAFRRYTESRESDRQSEATRPRASGIEVHHALALFDTRFVRVTVNHRCETGGRRIHIEIRDVVQEIDEVLTQFHDFREWK